MESQSDCEGGRLTGTGTGISEVVTGIRAWLCGNPPTKTPTNPPTKKTTNKPAPSLHNCDVARASQFEGAIVIADIPSSQMENITMKSKTLIATSSSFTGNGIVGDAANTAKNASADNYGPSISTVAADLQELRCKGVMGIDWEFLQSLPPDIRREQLREVQQLQANWKAQNSKSQLEFSQDTGSRGKGQQRLRATDAPRASPNKRQRRRH